LGNSMCMDGGNMSAVAALVQGAEAPTVGPWGDMKAMLQMFGLLASAFQGTRAVVNAIAPEPANVPEPMIVVPEPKPTPAPEIVPTLVEHVAAIAEPVLPAVEHVVVAEHEMAIDEPVVAGDPDMAVDEPEPVAAESESELDFEPLRMPASAESLPPLKRFREVIWEEKCDDEGMPVGPKRVAISNFDTFERKTMDFDACSDVIKPRKVFNLPPVILMTRMQCEAKIRERERQYKVSLTMQSIRALRNAGANGPSRIRLFALGNRRNRTRSEDCCRARRAARLLRNSAQVVRIANCEELCGH